MMQKSKFQRSPKASANGKDGLGRHQAGQTEKVAHGILAPYPLSTARLRLAEALSCRILLKEVSW
jgi:hypothetical protein